MKHVRLKLTVSLSKSGKSATDRGRLRDRETRNVRPLQTDLEIGGTVCQLAYAEKSQRVSATTNSTKLLSMLRSVFSSFRRWPTIRL